MQATQPALHGRYSSGNARVAEIDDGVAGLDPLLFVPRQRTIGRPLNRSAAKPGRRVAHPLDVLGIVVVVRCNVQPTAESKQRSESSDGVLADEPAVLMTGLRPRIGEENPHAGQ